MIGAERVVMLGAIFVITFSAWTKREKINAAGVASAVGSLTRAVILYADRDDSAMLGGPLDHSTVYAEMQIFR